MIITGQKQRLAYQNLIVSDANKNQLRRYLHYLFMKYYFFYNIIKLQLVW